MEQQLSLLDRQSSDFAIPQIEETDSTAPSPFLPGTYIQYAIDSTSLNYLKICPRLYQYRILEGWMTKEESVNLRFGIEYHKALQNYEVSRAAGISHEDSIFDVVRDLVFNTADWKSEHKYKNREFLIRSVIYYLDKYGENDPAKTHIMANGKPAVEVSFKFELDWGPARGNGQPYLLCGHLDRVVEFGEGMYVVDYKTTTSTPSPYYFHQYEPNNQMTLYSLASKVIFQSPIKGVMIDVCQVMIETTRHVRGFTYRTQDQIEEWLLDLRYFLDEAEGYATDKYWPMRDTSCDKYGGCDFREICSRSPGVREEFLKSNFVKGEKWNPLKSR